MALNPGTRLGPYEIVAPLGSGGMGEVYKARDTRLDRIVAVKVLREHLASDPDRRARFDREARAISKLNHPNICALYDIGHERSVDYIVVEHLEGQTLADRLKKGALPIDQALAVAIDIAAALEAAHRAGIVHRDLKPANVMLTKSGAKLLDFGIAKTTVESASLTAAAAQTTLTADGVLLGTVQYMSPEQLEGQDIDTRSDVFAFGAVLYEMLTGVRAFSGESQSRVVSAILEHEPPVASIRPRLPAALERVVTKCLAKEPDRRWQTAGDLLDELRWIAGGLASARSEPRSARRVERWLVLAVLLAAISVGAAVYLRPVPADTRVYRSTIVPTARLGRQAPLALSPDGRRLAFTAADARGRLMLWIRPLDSPSAQPLAGTEDAEAPFWSPDSQVVAFFADGKLKRVDASGGPPLILAGSAGAYRAGAWSRANVILYDDLGVLARVAPSGGEPSPATVLDSSAGETLHTLPSFLPDGRHFLFTTLDRKGAGAVLVGSLDSPARTRLIEGPTNARYAQGRLLFMRGTTLVTQPFDADRLLLSGQAEPIADNVSTMTPALPIGAFAVSEAGVLAFQDGGAARSRLIWFDRTGHEVGELGDREAFAGVFGNGTAEASLSPDGTLVSAVVPGTTGQPDIWIYDVARVTRRRLTFDGGHAPVWSPDSRFVAFRALRDGHQTLSRKAADGTGDSEVLPSNVDGIPESWSPDGQYIMSAVAPASGHVDLWVSPLFGDRKPRPFIQSAGQTNRAQFSPDGRWLAYQSGEAGSTDVYVARFPGAGGTRQVSTGGGREARWRRDGKELFYLAGSTLMAAAVTADAHRFDVTATTPLFSVPQLRRGAEVYDVAADGRRFLINVDENQPAANMVTLIVNWTASIAIH